MLALAGGGISCPSGDTPSNKVAIVAVSSNSSLCGAFNSNVIRETLSQIRTFRAEGKEVELFPVGRKMTEAMKKAGYVCPTDYNTLVAKHEYRDSEALAQTLMSRYSAGEFCEVLLVYNHFVSTSTQKVVVDTYLGGDNTLAVTEGMELENGEYIFEPGASEIAAALRPLVMNLRIHSMILDSVAAEYAARTVAMQIATDNANELLSSLTLEYNKGRQQKITAEILDLLGGMA